MAILFLVLIPLILVGQNLNIDKSFKYDYVRINLSGGTREIKEDIIEFAYINLILEKSEDKIIISDNFIFPLTGGAFYLLSTVSEIKALEYIAVIAILPQLSTNLKFNVIEFYEEKINLRFGFNTDYFLFEEMNKFSSEFFFGVRYKYKNLNTSITYNKTITKLSFLKSGINFNLGYYF